MVAAMAFLVGALRGALRAIRVYASFTLAVLSTQKRIAGRVLARRARLYGLFSVGQGRAASVCKTLAIPLGPGGRGADTPARKYAKKHGRGKTSRKEQVHRREDAAQRLLHPERGDVQAATNNPANDKYPLRSVTWSGSSAARRALKDSTLSWVQSPLSSLLDANSRNI